MNDFLNKLLTYYDLSYEEYLNISKEVDYSIFVFLKENSDFLIAKKLIEKAIKNNEKIIIYGDYDCDGIMSTSIIYNAIKKKNDYKCGFYIPFREKDGYGITKENIDVFLNLNYKLFILVDNGITLKENVEYIKEKGAKVIIIDHHEIIVEKEAKPDALIHWKYINEINKNNISAGALSFLFSYVYLNEVDEYLLSLGAISIISDLMPLINFNHKIVKLALRAINKNKFKEICLLMNKFKDINEEDIGSFLVPKVNSIGRIIKDNSLFNVVRYFLIDKTKDIYIYLNYINEVNEKRKELIVNFETNSSLNIDESLPYVLLKLDIEEGLLGLLANRFMDKFNKPTFILSKTNHDTLKGSARTRFGFNVVSFLKENDDLLINYGGHEFAGGFELKEENLEKFKERLYLFANENKFKKETKNTIDIVINEINKQNYELINSLAPFGKDFEKPLFKIKDISTLSLKFSKDNLHIINKLSFDSSLIYFNFPTDLLNSLRVNFIGYIDINNFEGRITYQFKANDYELGSN